MFALIKMLSSGKQYVFQQKLKYNKKEINRKKKKEPKWGGEGGGGWLATLFTASALSDSRRQQMYVRGRPVSLEQMN